MNRIFFLITLVLVFTANVFSQEKKVKVLLLGTTHSFKANLNQNFEQVIAKLYSFSPDLICVEAIPVTDTAIIHKYRKESFERAKLLQLQFKLTEKQVNDSVDFYYNRLKQEGNNIQYHLSLARYLYMAYDFKGNSDYQWWLTNYLSKQQQIAVSDTLANEYLQRRQYNEYYNVVFPVANRLSIEKIFLADDQTFYPNDIKAQKKTQFRLLFSFKGFKALKLIKSLKREYKSYDKEGRLFDFLNDSVFQNRFSDLIINVYPNWSKSKWAKQVSDLWKKRNQLIAERIKKAINDNPGAERVLVTFGAAHIPLLKFYLSQYSNIEIITYNNLTN